jgi:UDP-glucose 4-epimerase
VSRSAVVVTGATGFVGSTLVKQLLAQGHKVVAPLRDPSRAPVEATGVRWDLESGGLDESVLAETTTILHTAAFIPPDYADPVYAKACLQRNALGSLQLVQEAIAAGVGTFVQLSTGNLYRNQSESAAEDDPLYPATHAAFYLTSKLDQEIFTKVAANGSGLRLVTLRPSAIYGPGMVSSGMVPKLAQQLLAGESVELTDEGRYGVDLVFVDDVVAAIAAASERNVSGTFNVGSGVRATILEVATRLVTECGADESLIRLAPRTSEAASGFAALNITRAQDELGFTPTSLAVGLARYVEHLRHER